MNKLYTIVDTASLSVDVLAVPGGLLFITETQRESGNGIAVGLATSFVPMSDDDARSFVKGRE